MLKDGYAEVNGLRLHYVIDGEGKPIIFQHGFGQGWYQWKNQLAEFAKDHHVVAVDMPGFNESDKPVEVDKYKMRNLTACITGLADHLGYRKFTLVAHNLNGFGWIYAAMYPDRLEKLVIINAPHPNLMDREWRENPDQSKASRYVPRIQSPEGEKFLSDNDYAVIKNFMGLGKLLAGGHLSPAEYKMYMDNIAKPGVLTGWCNYYRATPTYGLSEKAATVQPLRPLMVNMPTLVIWGMKDHALLPGLLNGLEQYVPDMRIKRVPNGTHQVIHEEPALVNGYIREFLGSK
ncbi:MAG: alpha/beta hydrolase [Chloroflexi bacterium]|nr:alpha/beta hydrolase [Chloroflexota bacterium]